MSSYEAYIIVDWGGALLYLHFHLVTLIIELLSYTGLLFQCLNCNESMWQSQETNKRAP